MKKFLLAASLAALVSVGEADACTNLIVTRGASTDGSIMVSYSADSHQLYGALYKHTPPKRGYKAGEMLPVYEWESGRVLGHIPQVEKTYHTVGNMNEHQLVIAETTFGGRKELVDPDGIMDYGALIYITLQRAKTAREAISQMVELCNTYGYASGGESLTIADKEEVWILEMIGKGSRKENGVNLDKGIVWVAMRVPDGYISAHANQARITQFPKNDPENCLYAPDVISFARKMGFYDGTDEDFSFSDTYAPLTFSAMRGCEARVWAFFRRYDPSMDKHLDYAMGHNPANRMPLWIKPSRKISPKEVFDMMRDHYNGTPLDMTRDIGAGGMETPYRWRPMHWEFEGQMYVNERAIATQQTGFWFVAQTRKRLPDPIGGILWFGVDDAATSSLTPIYCSTREVPKCFREDNGSLLEYSETAAFWIYNRVAQFCYLNYNTVGAEVRKRVDKWENEQLVATMAFEERVRGLSPERMAKAATKYSVETAQRMFSEWVTLDKYLMVKYIDGNIKKEDANGFIDNGQRRGIPVAPIWPGYSDKWKEAVVKDNGDILRIPVQ
jgi:dipeptidase